MGLEHLLGVIKVHIRVNLLTITFMGKVCINGLMGENILEIGRIIRWMVREYLLGGMEGILL